MRFLSVAALIGANALALAQFPGALPPPAELQKGFESITQAEARDYLTFLATKCEGRGTGEPGFQKAADYVAEHFRRDGLKPVGDNGTYFQSTTFYRSRLMPRSMVAEVDGKRIWGARDFAVRSGSNVDAKGPVVLIRANGPKAELKDPESLKGKLVVLDASGVGRAFRGQLFAAGAIGILTIQPNIDSGAWRVSQTAPGVGGTARLNGTITPAAVARLLRTANPDATAFLTATIPTDSAVVTPLTSNLHLLATVEAVPVIVSNVVGLLEGSDASLKSEVIGIGGHLDHLGKRGAVVYPGADDDGSGSTAVLCIAKAMTENPKKPRRSILFMTFFGEEMGLLGSRFLSEHPPVPLENMVAELQMDMVGRDSYGPQNGDPSRMDKLEENRDTMRLVGSKRISTELDKTIQDVNRFVGFRFKYDAEDVYTRSDHYNFARLGVPIAFLFDGFTPDYHQPTDTVDKIDWLKLTNAAKLYYLTAETIADRDLRPVKDVK